MNSSYAGDSGGVLDKNWLFAPSLPQPSFGVWNPPGQLPFLWDAQIWLVFKTEIFFYSSPKDPFIKVKVFESKSIKEFKETDSKKVHKQELCEKCIFYGKLCGTVTKEEMRNKPFVPNSKNQVILIFNENMIIKMRILNL
jgi:hypothetical protein